LPPSLSGLLPGSVEQIDHLSQPRGYQLAKLTIVDARNVKKII